MLTSISDTTPWRLFCLLEYGVAVREKDSVFLLLLELS